jgi:N-acetylglutamate synthase-like GNAT family acetyltransferase
MTAGVNIRPAILSDHAVLDALMRRAALALPEYRDQLSAEPEAIAIPLSLISEGRVLVAEADGRMAGFAAWLPIGETIAELDGLFVDPSMWRSGVGMALLAAVSDAATQIGVRKIHVVANPGAESFYRRAGFERTGVTTTDFGPALTMLLQLQAAGTAPVGARLTRITASQGHKDER